MSDMKFNAIVSEGIQIIKRIPIPDDMIPEDSKVEIEAKVAAGYFTTGKIPTADELKAVKGRSWEDVAHVGREFEFPGLSDMFSFPLRSVSFSSIK